MPARSTNTVKPASAKPARSETEARKHPARAKTFRALLEPDHTALKWVIARVPFDVAAAWSTMVRLRVRGSVNGVPFRTSLFPMPGGQAGHFLLINRRMQTDAGVRVGAEADFVLEPDLEDRPADLPPQLLSAFEGDRQLLRFTESLSESNRREIGKWIAGVRGEDAQARRASQMAERLLLTMEGEIHTPPVLEALFAQSPKARAGWQALTQAQRRSHLLGIFYYRTPEARTRRAEKAVDLALKAADRR